MCDEVNNADEETFEIPEEIVEEETEDLRVAPSPLMPTSSEVEEHRITHYPYRSWCKFCQMCKALREKRPGGNDKRIPVVGMDYFYMTDGGLKTKVELDMDDEEVNQKRESGELVKCLLVRCFATKAVFAHVVPCKGIDDVGIGNSSVRPSDKFPALPPPLTFSSSDCSKAPNGSCIWN